MARRRSSYKSARPRRRSYSSSRSYRAPRRRRSTRSPGQTIRLVLQQPGMGGQGRMRAPFGSFQPTALFNPFMQPYVGQGSPWEAQGGPGIPGARMVINPVPAPGQAPDAPPDFAGKK